MATNFKKKIFLLVFCLASITQGMYSTYFVSILTTIERIYQIQSKTAGAILSATEIGQILGSLFIAYYGGRGNKPKWISVCMTLSALAALISISPHFILLATNNDSAVNIVNQQAVAGSIGLNHSSSSPPSSSLSLSASTSSSSSLASPYLTSDLNSISGSGGNTVNSKVSQRASEHTLAATITATAAAAQGPKADQPSFDQLCRIENYTSTTSSLSTALLNNITTHTSGGDSKSVAAAAAVIDDGHRTRADPSGFYRQPPKFPVTIVISIFSVCLLAIGFGSTAITTLGIPFIDDIISREESPFYLGLTIGLRIFGPALGFLLGSFCIRVNANSVFSNGHLLNNQLNNFNAGQDATDQIGAWWLGLIIISLPLLVLAIPMYFLSRIIIGNDSEKDDYADITYQAAEDHDIGGSHDFPAHALGASSSAVGLTGAADLDITSSRTCFSSELDSSSRDVLPPSGREYGLCSNYNHNIAFEQPILSSYSMRPGRETKVSDEIAFIADADNRGEDRRTQSDVADRQLSCASNKAHSEWRALNVCLVVKHLNDLESTTSLTSGANCGNSAGVASCPAAVADTSARQRDNKCKGDQQQTSNLSCVQSSPPLGPAIPVSARSSVASSLSSSSFVSGKNNRLRKKQLQQQQQQQPPQQIGDKSTICDLSGSLSRLLGNRLLTLRMLSGVLHILPIAGFYTFLPKYLIEQFKISSSSASAISGLAGILFVGFGAFIGGTIIRVLNVNSRIMTRWIAASAFLYAMGMILLMNLDCEQNHIVHFNSQEFVSTDCSLSCKCSSATYNPVCANGTTFISPCLAGCKRQKISAEGRVLFDDCGCAPSSYSLSSTLYSPSRGNESALRPSEPSVSAEEHLTNFATQGQCVNNCDNIFWYVIVFSLFTLIHASCEVGSMMFNLRCVRSDDRTLALGLITFSSSLLGTIPCSVIYGSVVDFTCVHWDTYIVSSSTSDQLVADDSARGACRAYDNDSFRYYLHGLTAMVMSLAFIVDCIISSRASEVDFYEGSDESKMDIRIGLKKSTETIQ